MTNLDDFIAKSMAHQPIESKIVKKIVNALNKAHDPITSIYDGEEHNTVDEAGDLAAINRIVFNLDECYLETASGGWIRLVLGNEWDCISDYTLNLEPVLKPINDYIDKHN